MMNKVDVLLGLQWGDEGKGKIVDVLAPQYDIVGRFQGGPNAGHTLVFDGIRHVLHTIPSGIFRPDATNVVGNGVVIDPVIFRKEIQGLRDAGLEVGQRLLLSRKAHLILPTHRLLDAASEKQKGQDKIGSTLKGIGPTYMDKTGRNGLRVGDILLPDFMQRYETLKAKHLHLLRLFGGDGPTAEQEAEWFDSLATLRALPIIDSEYFLNRELARGRRILAEGAQGSLLDIDFGSYPFVTSSNTICAGACTGLGIAPNRIGRVIGIFKAYCTRVGSGPFPTELHDEVGEEICRIGHEYGSTTGRKRRCGWLDLPALRYAIMINGVTELHMMKTDVLNTFSEIKVCTGYMVNGEVTDQVPYDPALVAQPVYTTMKGWNCDLISAQSDGSMPTELEAYISFIEEQVGVRIAVVSIGPDRSQTIERIAVKGLY